MSGLSSVGREVLTRVEFAGELHSSGTGAGRHGNGDASALRTPTPFGKLRPESREHIFVGEGKSHAIQQAVLSDDQSLLPVFWFTYARHGLASTHQ
jgi:hypothetical protein